MSTKALSAICFVFLGCCVNVIFLEFLVVADPGSGNLITFSQFVIISIEGFITTLRCGTKKPVVPFREYLTLVVFFFLVSTTNNMAFNFNISMTLHLIFRAWRIVGWIQSLLWIFISLLSSLKYVNIMDTMGSLMANMILGMIIMHKRYTPMKYISVGMISVGIAVCTIASGKDVGNSNAVPVEGAFSDYFWWVCGITILTFALFMSARMGLYQEVLYQKYGKHPREALFFTHFLPLPGFALLFTDLTTHIGIANTSEPLNILGLVLPCIWVYIAGNVLTQCVCINSVFVLTTECTSLTVTLVVTLRKFLSLIFSIFYFNNPFTVQHWVGTALVFLGTFLYSDIPGMIRQSKEKSAKKLKSK